MSALTRAFLPLPKYSGEFGYNATMGKYSKSSRRIIFAGTPPFAATLLQSLVEEEKNSGNWRIVAVYTQPSRQSGRGQKTQDSAVKQLALAYGIPVYEPVHLKSSVEQEKLASFSPDLMVVAAYGLILPQAVLAIPKQGCLNVHGSLLPRWRGAAPVQRAILSGDKKTGITLMQMEVGLDTGPMLLKADCPISQTDTTEMLLNRLAILGGQVLIEGLKQGDALFREAEVQNHLEATYASKITKEEACLDWSLPAESLERAIRAFNPWPVAYSDINGERVRIWAARLSKTSSTALPGTILGADKWGLEVATGLGCLILLEIQLPNRKRLPVSEVLKSQAQARLFRVGERFCGFPPP